jgi:predicted flap endonuclease-1-like 5' DNA nuclease
MSNYKVIEIEGIGTVYEQKLHAAGIKTTDHLLAACKDAKGRKTLAAATGVDESKLLKWANRADLMRIRGIGKQFAELLEAAGVDTVKELRTRNATSLTAKLAQVNQDKKLCGAMPSEPSVAEWITQAKSLPPVLTY